MFTINNVNYNTYCKYEFENCIFSKNLSRPSKSLIDCELYKEYSKINLESDFFNDFFNLNNKTKKIEYYLIRELINVFKLDNIVNESFTISFDSIIINEIRHNIVKDNYNIIICFENNLCLRNILINFNQLIIELTYNDSLIINFENLFYIPNVQIIYIISLLFKKVKIYYCKLLKQNIIYCYKYKQNKYITVFLKKIVNNWNKDTNIRNLNINVEEFILYKIKYHNMYIFKYYIYIIKNLINISIEDKELYFKNYIKKNFRLHQNQINCNHELKYNNLTNCYICSKCYELFMIY